MKTLLLSAGRKNGNSEILGKEALMRVREVCGSETEIIRLQELDIEQCIGCESCMRSLVSGGDGRCVKKDSDDFAWLLDQAIQADAIILSGPIYDLIPSGNLITLVNRALGVGRDYRNSCKKQKKIGAVIAVGGSDWTNFTEPLINLTLTNLSKGTIVVDRLIQGGNTAPAMVLLDEELLKKAALLGKRVADALTDREKAVYSGADGICPACHCSLLEWHGGLKVNCPFCNARGVLHISGEQLEIDWDADSVLYNRFTEIGEIRHQEDIRTANKKAFSEKGRRLIAEKKRKYMEFAPYVKRG